jgi:hypothetical protein
MASQTKEAPNMLIVEHTDSVDRAAFITEWCKLVGFGSSLATLIVMAHAVVRHQAA